MSCVWCRVDDITVCDLYISCAYVRRDAFNHVRRDAFMCDCVTWLIKMPDSYAAFIADSHELVGSLKLYVSFAEYHLFYRALLQKRPIILRSLLEPYKRYKYRSAMNAFIADSHDLYVCQVSFAFCVLRVWGVWCMWCVWCVCCHVDDVVRDIHCRLTWFICVSCFICILIHMIYMCVMFYSHFAFFMSRLCYSVLQRVAVCYSVLQCIAWYDSSTFCIRHVNATAQIHTHTHEHTHTHIHTRACIHKFTQTCMQIPYTRTHVHQHTHKYTNIHTHTHTLTW